MKKEYAKIENYPIQDSARGHHPHYVLYPVSKNGKWRAAEVVEGGYLDPFKNPTKTDFEDYKTCKKACDVHNEWLGIGKKRVYQIINLSMQEPKITQ